MATRAPIRIGEGFKPGGFLAESAAARGEEAESLRRPMRAYASLVPEPGVGDLRFGDFPYQEAWYSEEVAAAEEVVWIKSTQVGMCLRHTTRVLTADLRWVAIGELAVGAALVSVDEGHGGKPRGRKLRRAVVTAKWERERHVRELVMSDGRRLVATPEHRLLVSRGKHGRNTEWRRVERLEPGMKVRSVVWPWGAPDFEDGWFAGMLDGEGSMRARALGAELSVTQQLGPVYDRARAYLRSHGYAFTEGFGERPSGKPVGKLTISRGSDVMRLLGACRPTRFDPRGWWEGMSPPGTYGDGWSTITEINDLPAERVVDIETSTGTFIAEGFVSHNSAYAWRWAVRQCDQFGDTGLYIFPTDTHVTEFGDERIEPAIEESRYLQSRIQKRFVRHKRLKRIGLGFLHLRGSNSKAGAQSVAAQFIVFDEYDFLDPGNLPQIERRISGARQLGLTPRIRRLGTPTVEGTGIALAWEASDQRVWMVMCGECGVTQEITWEENVRWSNPGREGVMRAGHDEYDDVKAVERAWRACSNCEAELDVSVGEWVAKKPGAKVIGFHATRLIVPRTDLAQIVIASRSSKPMEVEAFENNDLGRPYSAVESSLDVGSILAACAEGGELQHGYQSFNPITMGVDVAGERNLNVRISEQLPSEGAAMANRRRALWIGEVASFRDVERLIAAFNVAMCAIDANPERRMARTLQASFPGRVVLVEYDPKNESPSMKVETGEPGTAWDGVPMKVRVNRTEAIDAMMDSIRQRRNIPLKDPPTNYVAHLRALKRKTVISATLKVSRVYETTGTQGDDYAHTEVYDLVATELWRMMGGVAAIRSQEGRQVPDEEIGFRRVRLADGDSDEYRPGLEGVR